MDILFIIRVEILQLQSHSEGPDTYQHNSISFNPIPKAISYKTLHDRTPVVS